MNNVPAAASITVVELDAMNYRQLADSPKLHNRFVELCNNTSEDKRGELIFAKEKFNFLKSIAEDPKLQKATALSLYGCFLDLAINGLSLDKGSKPLCYMLTRNAKVLRDGKESWETRAYLEVSPYGELVMRIRAGQIKTADNPVVVYEGDIIRIGLDSTGRRTVLAYEAKIPREPNARIMGGFIRLERFNGSYEIDWTDISEIDRLKYYSEKNNCKTVEENGQKKKVNGQANALYTSYNGQIDPGFFEAKIIKHAFRSYPKVKTGRFTQMETEESEHNLPVDYGFTQAEEVKEPTHAIDPNTAFGDETPESDKKGVTVTCNDDIF